MSEGFFKRIGVRVPEVYLPEGGTDLKKWSVVACDQYTSQPEYWQQVEASVGDSPSTLRITLPEIYLEEADCKERIEKINSEMKSYIDEGKLKNIGQGFVLVERRVAGRVRKGIIVALDLERYDYRLGSESLIRATEGTVLERIPPRQKVRKNAVIESPHIMVLIDDKEDAVIRPIYEKREQLKKLYDTELMQEGGSIRGWMVEDGSDINSIVSSLERLDDLALKAAREKDCMGAHLLFAVGDGNHSLASAKAHWVALKKTLGDNWENHPARFALVELVNVYDQGLEFEPIHRVVFNVNYNHLITEFEKHIKECGGLIEVKYYIGYDKMRSHWDKISEFCTNQIFSIVTEKVCAIVIMDYTCHTMAVGALQEFLDQYLQNHQEASIDYIHGSEVVREIGSRQGNIGFVMPTMSKLDLFKTVINDGVLPRKTFSMGEANEKRYYMECRKIVL